MGIWVVLIIEMISAMPPRSPVLVIVNDFVSSVTANASGDFLDITRPTQDNGAPGAETWACDPFHAWSEFFADEISIADGVKRMSEKYGGQEFAIHVKGLELSAYDPRGSFAQGVEYATTNRGGCHIQGASMYLESTGPLTINPQNLKLKAEIPIMQQNLACAINSMVLCMFTTYGLIVASEIWFVYRQFIVETVANVPLFVPDSGHSSFVTTDKPNIVVETIKCAEDGHGLIIRFYEGQRRRGLVTLTAGFSLAHVWRTNLLEEDQTELTPVGTSVSLFVKPYEIVTLRLVPVQG